eukprot:15463478-Alexandrium_andersonii.AAC.1
MPTSDLDLALQSNLSPAAGRPMTCWEGLLPPRSPRRATHRQECPPPPSRPPADWKRHCPPIMHHAT